MRWLGGEQESPVLHSLPMPPEWDCLSILSPHGIIPSPPVKTALLGTRVGSWSAVFLLYFPIPFLLTAVFCRTERVVVGAAEFQHRGEAFLGEDHEWGRGLQPEQLQASHPDSHQLLQTGMTGKGLTQEVFLGQKELDCVRSLRD